MLSTFQLPKFTIPDFETLKKLCVDSIKMLRGWCLGKLPVSLQFIGLISAYIFVVGIIECAVQYHFHLKSLSYFNSWTIGFRPQDGAAYNRLFFSYLVGIFGILGGVIYVQTLNYLPKCRAMLEWVSERIWGFILGGAIILAFITPYFLAVFCFKLVIGLLVCRLLLEVFPKFETAPVTKHQKYIGLSLVLCGMVAASLWMCAKAWYPVKLANDYLELPTSITIPATPNQRDAYLKMDVSVAMGCLLDPQGPFAKEIVGETTTVSDGELDVAARYSRNPSFMDQLKRAAPENA
ncbi:MAG: hypothetical protein K2Q32_06965, partial [Alphaproteobacteria bacterium]|nr:hypothetical protein [Alphaproteobacteria bacterium]